MTNTTDPIEDFIRVREALLTAANLVPPVQCQTPFVGHWHLMDVLAHLVGWDYTNLDAIEALTEGRTPAFYAHYNPQWATFNQRLIERYGAGTWDDLRESLRASQAAVVARLRALSPDELSRQHQDPNRSRPVTIAGILRAAVRDEQEHLDQLKAFLASSA